MRTQATTPSFLLLAATTPWVHALAEALRDHGAVTVVRLFDWLNNVRLRPRWPTGRTDVRRVAFSLPPGYAGTMEPIFRPLLRLIVDRERRRLLREGHDEPFVICPYPFLAPWVRQVGGRRLIYYNLDDYRLYDEGRARRTVALEDELVTRAALTICLSVHQVEALRAKHPYKRSGIEHFPLGVVSALINSVPVRPPETKGVGYVGNMTDRVDWKWVRRVAELAPEVPFHFVGSLEQRASRRAAHRAHWLADRVNALALPNVKAEGPVPQAEVQHQYWRHAVNWMPYDVTHPFNVASCPTKIMDALASGRPFMSTDLPEVRLYSQFIHVVRPPEEAAQALRALVGASASHDASLQIGFARQHTWSARARQLMRLLSPMLDQEERSA